MTEENKNGTPSRRYVRNMNVDGIGREGQLRISGGTVAVVGCGALGSLAAMQLAGAGVGLIRIADFDTIDVSNLQRQLFFSEGEAGQRKALVLADRMRSLNSEINVEVFPEFVTRKNARRILGGVDFVVEATDNPASKYMVDSLCGELGLPVCIGGVDGTRGQVTTVLPGASLRYRDIYGPEVADPAIMPCGVRGVLGPAAGVVASLQSAECLRYLSGGSAALAGRLLAFDLSTGTFPVFDL